MPDVITPLSPAEILRRLETAARRGRLAGFAPMSDAGAGGGRSAVGDMEGVGGAGREADLAGRPLLRVEAFGTPFDGDVLVFAEPAGREIGPGEAGASAARTRLRGQIRMRRKLPVIFAAVLVFTVWPGVLLTDSFVATFLPWLDRAVPTWWWYLPMTILPIPWVWRSLMQRSRATMRASAAEMMGKIAKELGPSHGPERAEGSTSIR